MAGQDRDLAGRRRDGDGLAATLTLQEAPDPRASSSDGSDDGDRGYLVVIEAGSSAEVKLPPAGTLVLGRAPDVEVPLRSQVVSRRHARLQVAADGVYIEDLGSHNGTRRNGEPLTATAPQPLRSGDVVTLCDVALVYYGPSRGAPSASTSTSVLGPPLALTDPLRFRHSLETECERAAQALRHLAEQVERGLRRAPQVQKELLARQRQQADVAQRHDRGRAAGAVDDRHLADDVAGAQDRQRDLTALVAVHRDLDAARADHEQLITRRVLRHEHRTFAIPDWADAVGQLVDLAVGDAAEQGALAQHPGVGLGAVGVGLSRGPSGYLGEAHGAVSSTG